MGCHHSHTHNGHAHGAYHGHAHNGVSFLVNHLTLPPNFNVYPAERHDESMCHWGRREEVSLDVFLHWDSVGAEALTSANAEMDSTQRRKTHLQRILGRICIQGQNDA
ncbi:hypothetical protein CEXT_523041 [Caerostris extrusa]|uniref:Uncharacterized protein n=1 Tax=Caerostris extrusa TaxID=172846 RepID=A0AAV4QVZ7_CAEEX|nr:hypothetical protein CEXT_523041 [Caerostris extrusa]